MLSWEQMDNNQNIGFDKQDIKEPIDIIDSEIDINVERKKAKYKKYRKR